eukprot:633069-Heterocapsa_arctica.AAC.1
MADPVASINALHLFLYESLASSSASWQKQPSSHEASSPTARVTRCSKHEKGKNPGSLSAPSTSLINAPSLGNADAQKLVARWGYKGINLPSVSS